MSQRLRFLLDTNILIPLQDSYQVLENNLANFVRLANIGGHQLLYHPATIADFERDKDSQQKARNLKRIRQYPAIENPASCPWNTDTTGPNDACDNEILYALQCDAVHALVTEDRRIHRKAKAKGLHDRVYTIQTAEDWLRRLHEPRKVILPNIQDAPLHSLTPQLSAPFFDSLREGYAGFDDWFRRKARENRMAWVYRDETDTLAAICIYATQSNEAINDAGEHLLGTALKLCTFKVGDEVRGRKIGELFLKAAFRFATDNRCENIFIHTSDDQFYLLELLSDFGFQQRGMYGTDIMLVKAHPSSPPNADIPALDYAKLYFPHYRKDASVQKFLVPIQPQYHQILFPELARQGQLFSGNSVAGNAIKQAYLCKAPSNQVHAGDLVLFYRSKDEMAVTTIGVVERYETHTEATKIMQLVSRRTVYSQSEIESMTNKPVRVMLFRLVGHFNNPIPLASLKHDANLSGKFMSITKISDDSFSRILRLS